MYCNDGFVCEEALVVVRVPGNRFLGAEGES